MPPGCTNCWKPGSSDARSFATGDGPVSVRTGAEEGDVGNRVAPAFLEVPVGAMGARTRLQRISRATKAIKASSMAVGADSIIGLGTLAPAAIHAMAARVVSRARWFNLVVSNFPAPQVPLYLGGARMLATYPGMPLAENCGLSIACTSLAGTMAFGLTADWDAVPDIELLARGIESSIGELAGAARTVSRRSRARRSARRDATRPRIRRRTPRSSCRRTSRGAPG